MFVKLLGCMSYTYDKFSATKDKPVIEVPDDVGVYLISTGRFARKEETPTTQSGNPTISTSDFTTSDTKPSTTEINEAPSISKMKVAELDALALQLGIKFEDGLSKSEKIERISAFIAENNV